MTNPSELYQKKPSKRSPKELDARILAAARAQADENANNQTAKIWTWGPAFGTTAALLIGFTFIFDFSTFKPDDFESDSLASVPAEKRSIENEPPQESRPDSFAEEDAEVFVMDETIVTGRKREESLAEIPVSQSVIDSNDVSDTAIDDSHQFAMHERTTLNHSGISHAEPIAESLSDTTTSSPPLSTNAAPVNTEERNSVYSNNLAHAKDASMTIQLVNITEIIPDLILDIRYAISNNFVGEPIDGYLAPKALLTQEAAAALAEAQKSVRADGLTLKIFDAYRPQRAVDHFIRWSQDPSQATKQEYYPHIEKSELFTRGYLVQQSSHSRGSTVDLTLAKINEDGTHEELDMGTIFDFFDPSSWPNSSQVSEAAQQNRHTLRDLMVEHGFSPFETEWWHFTLENEPFPNQYFDLEIE